MKTIGLLGGMSWESSIVYYRLINELVRERLGGSHSCKSVMYSVNFAEIEQLQNEGNWAELTRMMIDAGRKLANGGAECLVICTNTMHKMAADIEKNVDIPLIHIADAAAEHIKRLGLKTVGLMGTKFTMEQDFYTGRLSLKHGLTVIVPDQDERETIHSVIYHELVQGRVLDTSRRSFIRIIKRMQERGAEGVVLGCTEIPLLVGQKDSPIPVFDTMRLHAKAAVDFCLQQEGTDRSL